MMESRNHLENVSKGWRFSGSRKGNVVKAMNPVGVVGLFVLVVLAAWGCREEQAPEAPQGPETRGEVRASSTYVDYFGQPPTVTEGSCFALVGFYPPADQPNKIRPFPLFLFNRENHPQIIAEQLLNWGRDWDLGGVFSDPFPRGTELISLERQDDLLRIELSAAAIEEADIEGQKTIAALLGHSMAQFEGVERVMVVSGGVLLPGQADRGFIPDPRALIEPGAPLAVSVTGTWEEGESRPEEISVLYDRPVRIDDFRLTDASGDEIAGKYYRSVFDMAVVIHPANPAAITEGMPLRLSWRGKDFLDRPGQDERTFRLRRVEHP